MVTPLIYTPITKTQMGWMSGQMGRCPELEFDLYRCTSRYGNNQELSMKCYKEIADYRECVFQEKQFKRYAAMQQERKKQKRPYTETPYQDVASVQGE